MKIPTSDEKTVQIDKICNTCRRVYKTDKDFLTDTSRWRICNQKHLWFNCSCGSTLILSKGKYDWYKPEAVMRPEIASVFNRLASRERIPYIPSAVMEVQELLFNNNSTPEQIAAVLKREPLIASEVVRIADNMKVADGQKIKTLHHAIVYMGRKTLSEIIMTAAVMSFQFNSKYFNAQKFWEKSLLTGALAEGLARKFDSSLNAEHVYLAGALCNIGKVVAAIVMPDAIDEIYRETNDVKTLATWCEAEKRHKVIDHLILGEIASILWGLPEFVRDAASLHHKLPLIGEADLRMSLIDCVSYANQLSHWIMGEPHYIDQAIVKGYKARLKLSEESQESLVKELIKKTQAS